MSTTPPGPPAGTPPTGSSDDGALPAGDATTLSGDVTLPGGERPPVDAAAVLADDQVIEWLRAHHDADHNGDTGQAIAPAATVGDAARDPAITALLALLDDVSVVETAPLATVVPLRRHRTGRAIAAGVVALSTLSIGGVAAAAGENHPLRPLRDAVTSAAGSVASSALGSAVGAVIEAAVPGDQSRDSGRDSPRDSARADADPRAATATPGAGASDASTPGSQPPGAATPGAPTAATTPGGPASGPQTLPGTPPSGPLAGAPLDTSPDAGSALPAPGDPRSSGSIAQPFPTPSAPVGRTPRAAGQPAVPAPSPTAQLDPTVPAASRPTTERSRPVATDRSTPTPEAGTPRTSQGSDDKAARARALDSANESLDDVSVALDKGQIDKAGRLLERAAVRLASVDDRDAGRPRARLQGLQTRYAELVAAASAPSTAASDDKDKGKDDKGKDDRGKDDKDKVKKDKG